MSDALVEVWVNGVVVAYGRYQGSADLAHPGLAPSIDWEAIGSCFEWKPCEHDGVEALIYSDYGGGFHWPGRVCLECWRINEGHDPWLIRYGSAGYGMFTEDEQAVEQAWRDAGWPRDGRPAPGDVRP